MTFNPFRIFYSRIFKVIGASILLITIAVVIVDDYFKSQPYFPTFHWPPPTHVRTYSQAEQKSFVYSHLESSDIDWSRFAYSQYVTNSDDLCSSIMIFEGLHRLGSKAELVLMYPMGFEPEKEAESSDAKILSKAKNDYGVKLQPVEVMSKEGVDRSWSEIYTKLLAFNLTQYDRVINLDSDSTVMESLDELFFVPPSPLAYTRAYWLDSSSKPTFNPSLLLIQPSILEFTRLQNAIDTAHSTQATPSDTEIINRLYSMSATILPHRPYTLLTSEFRGGKEKDHSKYLGNDVEEWDPDAILKEAKFISFRDRGSLGMEKYWEASTSQIEDAAPVCEGEGEKFRVGCRNREIWLAFYSDFKRRRNEVCK